MIPPGVGPDSGKDLIVSKQGSEDLYLVSCKELAVSGRSVGIQNTSHELNILDRMAQHNCKYFIGFYSTHPSQSLITRLVDYRDNGRISDFEIFNGAKIEKYFINNGFSDLFEVYFLR